MGNGPFQRHLGWPDKKYWVVHQELFDSGVIEQGRGRGGTVILVPQNVSEAKESAKSIASDAGTSAEVSQSIVEASAQVEAASAAAGGDIRELDLYEPALKQLQKHWTRFRQLDHCLCEITAMQGRRDTGGSWSRPDLAVVGYKRYEYLPNRELELFSFEVKPSTDVSIKGVLEALAHREFATRSYVIFHTAGRDLADFPEDARIQELAARHGVGVFAAREIDDFETWDEHVSATRSNADPEYLDTFIKRTLSEDTKSRIRRWF
jgi:hypothetical protein